jgi:hypothetical protein
MRGGLKNSSFVYSPKGRGGAIGRFKGFDLLGRRWGFDRSTVYVEEEKYLDRWILYVNGYTLRLHKFYRGDDDRASHDHPWTWFVTFPLGGYVERIFHHGEQIDERIVWPWRLHYRPADFEHYVVQGLSSNTWWTIVATGVKRSGWGFYPAPGKFVPWREWT